jgi:hypothetical protein
LQEYSQFEVSSPAKKYETNTSIYEDSKVKPFALPSSRTLRTKQELVSRTSRNAKANIVLSPLKQNKDLPLFDYQNSEEIKKIIISVRQKKNRNSAINSGLVKTVASDAKTERKV